MEKLSIVLVMVAAASLGACTGNQQTQRPVSRIDRIQPDDNTLTCALIQDQITKADKIIGDAKVAQGDANAGVNAASTGGTAAAVGTGLLGFVPIVGGIASVGVGTATGQAAGDQAMKGAQAMQDEEDARERKNTLVAMGNDKKCFDTTSSK